MKSFYYILALAIVTLGFICWWKYGDMDTFHFSVIVGLLFNIYAKVEDL